MLVRKMLHKPLLHNIIEKKNTYKNLLSFSMSSDPYDTLGVPSAPKSGFIYIYICLHYLIVYVCH